MPNRSRLRRRYLAIVRYEARSNQVLRSHARLAARMLRPRAYYLAKADTLLARLEDLMD